MTKAQRKRVEFCRDFYRGHALHAKTEGLKSYCEAQADALDAALDEIDRLSEYERAHRERMTLEG